MRLWRNWQTRTVEGRVSQDVWVQVPPIAPSTKGVAFKQLPLLCVEFSRDLNPRGLGALREASSMLLSEQGSRLLLKPQNGRLCKSKGCQVSLLDYNNSERTTLIKSFA